MSYIFTVAVICLGVFTAAARPGVCSFSDPNPPGVESSISLLIQPPNYPDENQWSWVAQCQPGQTNIYFNTQDLVFKPWGTVPNPVMMTIQITGTNGQTVTAAPVLIDTNNFSMPVILMAATNLTVQLN